MLASAIAVPAVTVMRLIRTVDRLKPGGYARNYHKPKEATSRRTEDERALEEKT